jgi:hypothetical protein
MITTMYNMLKKTTFQFQIKFSSPDYLQMYKILQLVTNIFTLNTKIFTSINVNENTCVQTQKVIKMLCSLWLGLN